MWEILGNTDCLATATWPTFDENKLVDNEVTYAISVNGKLRDKALIDVNATEEEVKNIALSLEKVKAYTDGHQIVKVIVVPKKIVNIVIK